MKYIKFAAAAILMLFCFVLSGELFQMHLVGFTSSYYTISIDIADREQMCSVVTSVTEAYGEHVFAVQRSTSDAFHSQLTIYADGDTQALLCRAQDLAEGEAKSFFSGSTEVLFRPFAEVVEDEDVTAFYFTGSKDTIAAIRDALYDQIPTSYFHKGDPSIEGSMMCGIWCVALLFILLLTWADIQFSKKSDFLKLAMGSSVGRMILEKILLDAAVLTAIAAAAYLALRGTVYLRFRLDFCLAAMPVFLALNSLMYLTLLRVNYKEVIYGANINGKLLVNSYVVQACVAILMVVSLSFNLIAIQQSRKGLAPYDTIEQMDGYYALSITPADSVSVEDGSLYVLKMDILLESYRQGSLLLSTVITDYGDSEENVILLNDLALDTVVSDPDVLGCESEADFIIFIPGARSGEIDCESMEDFAHAAASSFGLEEYSYETKEYTHVDVVYFDFRSDASNLPYGSELASDPIMVYCNLSEATLLALQESHESGSGASYIFESLIFKMEDTAQLSEGVTARLKDAQLLSVIELCGQYKASLLRGLIMNSVVSIFLLILGGLLISMIVKLEYMVHAKELALQKIMGYTLLQRNAVILGLEAFAVSIAFITGVFLSKMYGLFDMWTLTVISLAVLLLNSTFLLVNMGAAERHNTAHILKGGSL
ncbi:MAG: hypothetical protein LUJ09_08245 [Firmicutes bacterium]|nr:hypothetical protein [Bacillota bacterium]